MTQYQLIFIGLFGFFLYPVLANSGRNQRQNACLALGALFLGALTFSPAISSSLEVVEHPINVGIAALAFLLFAGGMLSRNIPPYPKFTATSVSMWAFLFGLLTTIATNIHPSLENCLLAAFTQILCLFVINRDHRFQHKLAIAKRMYFSLLFPLAFLATELHMHGLVVGEYFGEIARGIYWVLLASAGLNLMLVDFQGRRLRLAADNRHMIEPSAMRLAYRSRRILKDFRHDLRQPLSTLGILASVGRAISKDPEVASRYSHIQTAQKALKNMLEEFFDELDTSVRYPFMDNLAPLKMVVLDDVLQPLVDEYRLLAQAKGLELRYVQSSYQVHTNTEALTKILRNGLDNAIKYTEHGGAIVGVRPKHDHFSIQIVDTGPGVETNPAQQNHKGWGHGSTIVQDLSDQIMATTECRNRIQLGKVRGSVFEVRLPKISGETLPDETINADLSTRLCASVVGFSSGSVDIARLHFSEDGFDDVNYLTFNKCHQVLRKLSQRCVPVYIAYSESTLDTKHAKDFLHTVRSLSAALPCCVLLHPVSESPKKRVEFSKDLIEIPFQAGHPENAFKILAELFPSRGQIEARREYPKAAVLEEV